jgi:hypothetical protein
MHISPPPPPRPTSAFEKHRIRLRMAAGAWRDYHEPIHARLPFVHSCTADAAAQARGSAARRRAPRARGAQPRPVLHLRCARGGGRAPPRSKLAALRSQGVPTFSGLRDLGHVAQKTHKARRSSAGALLNTSPPPRGGWGISRGCPAKGEGPHDGLRGTRARHALA